MIECARIKGAAHGRTGQTGATPQLRSSGLSAAGIASCSGLRRSSRRRGDPSSRPRPRRSRGGVHRAQRKDCPSAQPGLSRALARRGRGRARPAPVLHLYFQVSRALRPTATGYRKFRACGLPSGTAATGACYSPVFSGNAIVECTPQMRQSFSCIYRQQLPSCLTKGSLPQRRPMHIREVDGAPSLLRTESREAHDTHRSALAARVRVLERTWVACSAPVAAYRETSKNCRMTKRTHGEGALWLLRCFPAVFSAGAAPWTAPILRPGTGSNPPTQAARNRISGE
jgi:hypothetical protein